MKKLGEGGMGQVYLAEHVKMGRKSALKVMHPGMKADVDAISRFNREAANASRIAHPNVAAVYDFGETPDGIIYLAMEFVDGPPLTKIIEEQGALPPKRAGEIVRQVAEALAVAHDMSIVHRDLKPDNIMVAKTRDGGDLVKVVDFGIAKAAGSEAQKVTKTGLVVGTPEYMSPEQLAGDKLDGRSDIYSLGLVAFNMLTGKLPFPSDSAQESMIMRLTDAPKPLAEMKPEVAWPADVQQVMDKALSRDVTQRYQNATEFGNALYRAIDRMPETAAAEMGTQVMGAAAVPPTRVAAAPGAPAAPGAATVAVPTPVASATVTQSAAPAKKKNMIPLMGGIAAVVVIGGVGAFMLSRPKASAVADSAKPSVTQQAEGAPADSRQASTNPVSPAPAGSAPKTQPLSHEVSKSAGADKPVSVDKQLDDIIDQSKDAAKAQGLLKSIEQLALTTNEQKAKAGIAKYNIYLFGIGDQDKACAAIEDVEGVSKGTKVETLVTQTIRGCTG
ncbi:MAG TPA: protein kinase [Gemmatimonadaceae bacterium]|nr:protein kinase [Gemmatimonadaceae bacterium]